MCQSLYVKANGEMPCWDDVGEELILRTLNESALRQHREPSIFYGAQLEHIRRSFIEGRDPHPGVCDRCAVRGHGSPPSELHPRGMEVLHLEASYLCHLSCPQCIPARERRNLKGAPYNMTPGLLDGLMEQLRREGVERIGFIHFEGRGDPLVNTNLPELIALSKRHFPKAFVGVTTHCSYPYMPWIVSSGLDMLRVSIDGATPESYARYRVGGDFGRTMEFLRKLRDDRIRNSAVLRVEWKYILFEWNDTDDEMRRAAALARVLQVHLTFVLTHSPGRSLRFQTSDELQRHVLRVAPSCAIEKTFQLRTTSQTSAPSAVIAEHVAGLLSLAVDRIRAGRESEALRLIEDALKRDPGVDELKSEHTRDAVREALPRVLQDASFPSTLTWYAALSREVGDIEASDLLLARHLEIVPNAPDRNRILCDRLLRSGVAHIKAKRFELGHQNLRQAVFLELGFKTKTKSINDLIRYHSQRIVDSDCSPSLAAGLANVALMERLLPEARALFLRYLERAPDATDRKCVQNIIAEIDQIHSSPQPKRTLAGRAWDALRCVFRDRHAAIPPSS